MAQVVSPSTIRLNNGQTVAPQKGGWYDGQQFFNGSLSNPGQINSQSPQQGAGQQVSAAVVAQTNPANVDYLAKQGAPPPTTTPATPTPSTPTTLTSPIGSTDATGATGSISAAPTIDLVAITNAAYNTPEITAAKKAITDRQTALNTALAGINDNPFYSEATRVGKVAKLTDEANADIKVQQDTLASLKADAAIKVNAAQGQYNIDNTAYQENLKQFDSLLSSGALDNASGTDIANLATQTGIPTSMIHSMVTASKAKNAPKVSIVQATDNQGNLTILGVDSTGKIVQQTTIPGAGKEATYKGQVIGENGVSGGGGTTAQPKQADQIASVAAITADYLRNKQSQARISPEDLYKELLLQYPGASSYISKYWTPAIIRALAK